MIKEDSVISLVGVALLRTSWTTDVAVLGEPCLVLCPEPG